MKKTVPIYTIPFLFLFLICLSGTLKAQEVVHRFDEGLTVPLIGKYGREAVFQDHLLWQIAEGEWETPMDGSIVESDEKGNETKWLKIATNSSGVFKHRNLRGGYLYCEYDCKKPQVLILEANGHNVVYVNGEPRGGDVYSYGWVQHPVKLKKGKNTFLFRGSRGQLTAKLSTPSAKTFLSDRDPLIPDWEETWTEDVAGAVRVINASSDIIKGYQIISIINGKQNQSTDIPHIGPLTSRKVPFMMNAMGFKAGETITLSFILLDSKGREVKMENSPVFNIKVKGQFDKRKETFFSDIDGSVQYYSLVPPSVADLSNPALFFSMHGASVEAVNQAAAYAPKDWGMLVAPTNRRPYGFDWEDWGRMDGKEVLEIVIQKYQPDPNRMYLTGHSMGGHGAWQFGVTYPGYWAAIAPSAGWYSFGSNSGKDKPTDPNPMEDVFIRASNPSNTLGLSENYLHYGIYILHGDADDNVPVSQARFMREHLAGFHADFCYYERPGAGHWWGNLCVDWPPLFQFFKDHKRPEVKDITNISFSTSCPAVSSESRIASIWQQEKDLEISSINIKQDTTGREISVKSNNVRVLKLDLSHLQKGQPYNIICETDSFKVDPGLDPEIFLEKNDNGWSKIAKPGADQKGPQRYGMFKEAFRNNMIFVYATGGTKAENAWAYQKARFDAETFWYRGNGSIDVISDEEFLQKGAADRNIILYGHSEMNKAWDNLLQASPIQVKRGQVSLDSRIISGDNLAVNFIFPRKDEINTSVGIVAGTGMPGMITAYPNRYFVSGSGYPDFMVFSSQMLKNGLDGVEAAGFFDRDWKLPDTSYINKK